MSHDRVTYNDRDNWLGPDHAVGMVDEIVLSDATVHLEMLGDNAAYLGVSNPAREVTATIIARPTTRTERRQVLARTDDRLRDHLAACLPRSRTRWSCPWWQRPGAAVREWWAARQAARAVLLVRVNEDTNPDADRG